MNEDTSNDELVEGTDEMSPETDDSEPSGQQEEPQQEKPRMYAGKYKSAEDLEKAYQEAQRLISSQGQKIKMFEKPSIPDDKKAILDELRSLGVVTKDDLDQQKALLSQQAKDDSEIKALNLTEQQESALRRYATHQDNVTKTMTECWEELTGFIGGKVISRKTTIKPKTGTRSTFKPKSQSELVSLPKAEYDQYWKDYAVWKAENN
jgi:hypothetical protein